jgi:hypothetical protein
MQSSLEGALAYAARGWPVYPQNPVNRHGAFTGAKNAATTDRATIEGWSRRWPDFAIAVITGAPSGIVALDVDVKNGADGRDTLEMEFSVSTHPETPTDHSPNGGYHCLFRHPGHFVKSGPLGPGLEIKADNLWITLPPGIGRSWDPHLSLDAVPIAEMPQWLVDATAPPPAVKEAARPKYAGKLSRYGEVALDDAIKRILGAGAGIQEQTFNRECFSIGQLAGGGVIPAGLAMDGLLWATRRVSSLDARRPWRAADLERKARASFTDGLRDPRQALP